MATQYLSRGTRFYMGDSVHPDPKVKSMGRMWSLRFMLSQESRVALGIDNTWLVDVEKHQGSIITQPGICVTIDGGSIMNIGNNGPQSASMLGTLQAGQHELTIQLFPYQGVVDDILFEGVSITADATATVQPIGQPYGAGSQPAYQPPPLPQQQAQMPGLVPGTMQFATPAAESRRGCRGAWLGIAVLVMAALIAMIAVIGIATRTSALNNGESTFVCASGILFLAGMVLGLWNVFSRKKSSRTLCILYLIITPILYIILSTLS
jgi:hypothetical protein